MNCLNCNKEFEIRYKGSGGGNRVFCYECMPSTSDRNERRKQRYDLLLQYSTKIKLERGCDVCGYNKCAAALEWHHDNDDKDAAPAISIHYSINRYVEETKKCDLLCANCHREKHYGGMV